MRSNVFFRKTVWSKFFGFCCAIALCSSTSCSGDDGDDLAANDCANTAWTQLVSDEATAYTNALLAYNENPTEENCNTVKTFANAYLEALRDIADCIPQTSQTEVNQAIDEAKEDVDNDLCG